MRQVGIFGKRKSGKSALMYALTNYKMANETEYSAMEIAGVGKIMLVDTVGVDVEKSTAEKSAESIEVALVLISNDSFELELAWISKLKRLGAKIIIVISKCDSLADAGRNLAAAVAEVSGLKPICTSAETGAGVSQLHEEIINNLKG